MHGGATAGLTQLLNSLSDEEIAERLTWNPIVAAALLGFGPLAYYFPRLGDPPRASQAISRGALARVLESENGIYFSRRSLDRVSHQLWQVALYYNGSLTFEQAQREANEVNEDRLRASFLRIEAAFLATIDDSDGRDTLRLLPHAMRRGGLPARPIRQYIPGLNWSNEILDLRLARLGVASPKGHTNKIEALLAALSDPTVVRATINQLSKPAIDALNHIAVNSLGVSVRATGMPYYLPIDPRYPAGPRQRSEIHNLVDTGLVFVDASAQHCWIWMEVLIALQGRVIPTWPEPKFTNLDPIDTSPPGALAQAQLARMLEVWATEPMPALKAGGLSIRSARTTAKALGIAEDLGAVLAAAALEIGLLTETVEVGGKGRKVTHQYFLETNQRGGSWAQQDLATRWISLVQGWADHAPAGKVGSDEGPTTVEVRRLLIGDLMSLPRGRGIAARHINAWLIDRRLMYEDSPEVAPRVIKEMRWLGLIPEGGAVGLTDLGRALLADPTAVLAALPPTVNTFVVQADHSVGAPPDLAADVRAMLERIAVVTSTGAMTMMRLDQSRIAATIAAGTDVEELISFLRDNSTVAVPAPVERFLRDVARSQGGLRVVDAVTVLVSDDTMALSSAVGVKAAGLTAISATVAVSALKREKVLAELRKKGIHASATGLTVGAAYGAQALQSAPGATSALGSTNDFDCHIGPAHPDEDTLTMLLQGKAKS